MLLELIENADGRPPFQLAVDATARPFPDTNPSTIDFGRSADDYACFRGGFPAELFDRLAQSFSVGLPGQRLLDVGTGTGALAREFARNGCTVTATDPSSELLAQARDLDIEAGVEVEYLQLAAEHSDLPSASFDVVTAGRCWHWFDRPAAAAEILRLLRPGGTLAITHFDRVALAPGGVLEATQALIERWNPNWAQSPPLTFGGGIGALSGVGPGCHAGGILRHRDLLSGCARRLHPRELARKSQIGRWCGRQPLDR